ncbi:MAG: Fic family protein [Flavobacteriaceae bacterium]|nr:Fic family protein [Flavobacteriaceae bacterium]
MSDKINIYTSLLMKNWNWRHKDWANFTYDKEQINDLELELANLTGVIVGILKSFDQYGNEHFLVDLMSNEALKTSEIEGELLNRDSVQSSIQRNLGFKITESPVRKVTPTEYGIAEMMVDLYENFDTKLTDESLFEWHKMLTNGRRDLLDIGRYRTHKEPMQIVSGSLNRPIVHYEAPPSSEMQKEMSNFIKWFNDNHFDTPTKLTPIVKAGITHFYFVTIHPFEDGNGRIARALTEKSLGLSLGKPSYTSLSKTINENKKMYYTALEKHNTTLNLTDWLVYFGELLIQSHKNTIELLEFTIAKTHFFDKHKSILNERQIKVIQRIFKEGVKGFDGGLSAKNYKTISGTSDATTTRDLKDLVDKGVFTKMGKLKSTRYFINN